MKQEAFITSIIFFLCLMTMSLSSAQTGTNEKNIEFDSEQLQSIRDISQTVLKVRGQERQKVLNDNRQLRADLKAVREVLEEAVVVFDTPSLVIHNQSIIQKSQKNSSRSLRESTIGASSSSTTITNKMEQAKAILLSRKNAMASAPASKKKTKGAQNRTSAVEKEMEVLLMEIESVETEKGMEKRKKMQAIINRLNARPKPLVSSEPKPEPTITTMTKHFRKQ